MRYHVLECLAPRGWGLFKEGEPAALATFGPDHERTAQLCAVLLNAREEAPATAAPARPTSPLREPARPARIEDEEGPDTWTATNGAEVRAFGESGWAYVRFERRPPTLVLDDLRSAGARWLGVRRGWRIRTTDLPLGYECPAVRS